MPKHNSKGILQITGIFVDLYSFKSWNIFMTQTVGTISKII